MDEAILTQGRSMKSYISDFTLHDRIECSFKKLLLQAPLAAKLQHAWQPIAVLVPSQFHQIQVKTAKNAWSIYNNVPRSDNKEIILWGSLRPKKQKELRDCLMELYVLHRCLLHENMQLGGRPPR